jgi:hypothetical protein
MWLRPPLETIEALPAHDQRNPVMQAQGLSAMTRRAVLWTVAALLGLAVTAALTWSVSWLTRERVGLSSEPSSVIHGLAPSPALRPRRANGTGGSRPAGRRPFASSGSGHVSPTAPSATTPRSAPAPVVPVSPHPSQGDGRDDSGGGSRAGSGGQDD